MAASTRGVPRLEALLQLRVPGELPPRRKSLTARLLLKTNISEAGDAALPVPVPASWAASADGN